MDLIRPNFKAGMPQTEIQQVKSLKLPKRVAVSNRGLIRNNFQRYEPVLRGDIPLEKLVSGFEFDSGLKVQLDDKTMDKLFSVVVPDENDTEWLTEKARMDTNGIRGQPLGRKQRQKKVMTNITSQFNKTSDKICVLLSALFQTCACFYYVKR